MSECLFNYTTVQGVYKKVHHFCAYWRKAQPFDSSMLKTLWKMLKSDRYFRVFNNVSTDSLCILHKTFGKYLASIVHIDEKIGDKIWISCPIIDVIFDVGTSFFDVKMPKISKNILVLKIHNFAIIFSKCLDMVQTR